MSVYNLLLPQTRAELHEIIGHLASAKQVALQKASGNAVYIAKNNSIVNTCIDMACESIEYHKIDGKDISNEKKFAHVCFWMIKLNPISYIVLKRNVDLRRIINIFKSSGRIQLEELPEHVPVNTELAYQTFVTLYCTNRYKKTEIADRIKEIMDASYSQEVIKSLRFHNYSARAMAMFLETTVMEKLG